MSVLVRIRARIHVLRRRRRRQRPKHRSRRSRRFRVFVQIRGVGTQHLIMDWVVRLRRRRVQMRWLVRGVTVSVSVCMSVRMMVWVRIRIRPEVRRRRRRCPGGRCRCAGRWISFLYIMRRAEMCAQTVSHERGGKEKTHRREYAPERDAQAFHLELMVPVAHGVRVRVCLRLRRG